MSSSRFASPFMAKSPLGNTKRIQRLEDKIEDMQVWLYGREAGLHWPNCEIIKNDINSQTHITKKIEGNLKDTIEPHAKECIEFAEFVANDQPVTIPAEHSLQVMKILDGIYKSQEVGKEIILE